MRLSLVLAALAALLIPARALAWGAEGHAVVALIARSLLRPEVRAKVDALLDGDAANALTTHDIAAEADWADAWRGAGHKETASWHFVNIELDHPDLVEACFGFPNPGKTASSGPAKDCVVNKIEAFSAELKASETSPEERLLALKYLLHFVGDLGQPLHGADNHDRGGNCVLLALGGTRTVNLHAYWDTAAVEALGSDASDLSARLLKTITPQKRAVWTKGGPRAWADDSYAVAQRSVYLLGSPPGCMSDPAPIALPPGYAANAAATAAEQLAKSGARLAALLNQDL
jgi:hypothetical protein